MCQWWALRSLIWWRSISDQYFTFSWPWKDVYQRGTWNHVKEIWWTSLKLQSWPWEAGMVLSLLSEKLLGWTWDHQILRSIRSINFRTILAPVSSSYSTIKPVKQALPLIKPTGLKTNSQQKTISNGLNFRNAVLNRWTHLWKFLS